MESTFEMPRYVYHGSRTSMLEGVAARGIEPRSLSGVSNWGHTVESRADAVYLTTAYALYYAIGCQLPGDPVLFEIDTTQLAAQQFAADEDGVAQLPTGRVIEGLKVSLEDATRYWREHIEEVHPSTSLRSIGNCTFFGAIPPGAISRVLTLTDAEAMRLTLSACDPVVSVMNFRFFGETFQAVNRWFFDPQGPCPGALNEVTPPNSRPLSFTEALDRYRKQVPAGGRVTEEPGGHP